LAATAQGSALAADSPITASSLGTVASVHADGELEIQRVAGSRVVDVADPKALADVLGPGLLAQPEDSTVVLADPVPLAGEVWRPGHEVALIEEFADGQWSISDVQRLLRAIGPAALTSRSESILVTREGDLKLEDGSESRGDAEQFSAVPLEEVAAGDTVAGLGYLDSDGRTIDVLQLGVEQT
jgi:hypothetical protein